MSRPVCLACERVRRGDVNLDDLEHVGNGDRACSTCGLVYYAPCFELETSAEFGDAEDEEACGS